MNQSWEIVQGCKSHNSYEDYFFLAFLFKLKYLLPSGHISVNLRSYEKWNFVRWMWSIWAFEHADTLAPILFFYPWTMFACDILGSFTVNSYWFLILMSCNFGLNKTLIRMEWHQVANNCRIKCIRGKMMITGQIRIFRTSIWPKEGTF